MAKQSPQSKHVTLNHEAQEASGSPSPGRPLDRINIDMARSKQRTFRLRRLEGLAPGATGHVLQLFLQWICSRLHGTVTAVCGKK